MGEGEHKIPHMSSQRLNPSRKASPAASLRSTKDVERRRKVRPGSIPPTAGSTVPLSRVSPLSSSNDVRVPADVPAASWAPYVLVIDDEPAIVTLLIELLTRHGFRMEMAVGGTHGLAPARSGTCALILLEHQIPGLTGLNLLRGIQAQGPGTITKVPACGQAEAEAEMSCETSVSDQREGYTRWTRAMLAAIRAPADVRTVELWAQCANASGAALRGWCRTSGLPVKPSLLLARVLRAVIRSRRLGGPIESFLDVADHRTLLRLFAVAGVDGRETDVQGILRRQQLIRNPVALRELERVVLQSLP